MAPDINTVPLSPHRRHASTPMSSAHSPAPLAPSSNPMPPPSAHPLHREPASGTAAALGGNSSTTSNAGVGTGPGMTHGPRPVSVLFSHHLGPLRHPRPLTAADLHMQLEKEQEAVVSSRSSLDDALLECCSLRGRLIPTVTAMLTMPSGQPSHSRTLLTPPANRLGRFDNLLKIHGLCGFYRP